MTGMMGFCGARATSNAWAFALIGAILAMPTSAFAQRRAAALRCEPHGVRQANACVCEEDYHPVYDRARNAITCRPSSRQEGACEAPRHESEGHCCGQGEEWVGSRSSCLCVDPQGCASGANAEVHAAETNSNAARGVPTQFVSARDGEHFVVTVDQGGEARSCATPCTLRLGAGQHAVAVAGDGSYSTTLTVQTGGMIQVRVHRRRIAPLVWGIIDIVLGVPLLLGGTAATVVLAGNKGSGGALALSVGSAVLGLAAVVIGAVSIGQRDYNRLEITPARSLVGRANSIRLIGLGGALDPNGGASLGATFTF